KDDDSRLRGTLLAMHEAAQENFRANLNGPAGEAARAYLAKRGVSRETIEQFGLGHSDRSGRTLLRLFEQRNFPAAQMEQSGLVEGYMDAIGVTAAGFGQVVASCGTALTAQQVKLLKQHTARIVVNFDPDTAGVNAAERSINLLLEEGMQVRILELDGGLDPD